MPFVSVRDLQMYYEIRGTGQRLLSISGTGGDLRRSPCDKYNTNTLHT